MTATARWSEEHAVRTAASADIAQLWAEIEGSAVAPVILVLEAGGAEAHAVVGDTTGTALLYYPGGYEKAEAGSLHSVGDRARAERDDWESPLTAYYFGHHTEFPRWSVVPSVDGRRALAEFCERPNVPPTAILGNPTSSLARGSFRNTGPGDRIVRLTQRVVTLRRLARMAR